MTVMTKTIGGLAAILLAQTAYAETKAEASVQEEIFVHNGGALTETKARGTLHMDSVDVGYLARNRLLIRYDGSTQETLTQELSLGIPFLQGVRPTGQLLLKDNLVAPQLGVQYAYKKDAFSISTAAVWRLQESPVVEWRTTATYALNNLAFEAENFTWFAIKDPSLSTGTIRLHAGYILGRFQAGIAGELFYPTPTPAAGVYGRMTF